MASHDYHFITRWRFDATIHEVADILVDAPSLPRWWPSVYLDAREIEPGHPESRVGRTIRLFTKGWLPYTLQWDFRVTENRYPHGFALDAWGDFEGRGIWTLSQVGGQTYVTYDWKIRAEKPLLKYFSFAMKPFFAANHEWAMRRGEESLRLELLRRRARTDDERARVAPPPPPTFARWLRKSGAR